MKGSRLLKSAAVLIFILFVTVFGIIVIYQIVGTRVERSRTAVPEEARMGLFEGASVLEPVELPGSGAGVEYICRLFDDKERLLGYVMDLAMDNSTGQVRIRIAIDDDGIIKALKVLDAAETPTDLGFKAKSSSFTDSFIGASSVTTDPADLGSVLINFPEGAENSCEGVYNCVTVALQQFRLIEESEKEGE